MGIQTIEAHAATMKTPTKPILNKAFLAGLPLQIRKVYPLSELKLSVGYILYYRGNRRYHH